jgi:hypothetical protein
LEFVSYADILSVWRKSLRNGSFRRLPLIEKGIFRAALCYAKMKGRIINPRLVGMIKGVADRVCKGLRRRMFEHGLNRAWNMLSGKCCKFFPAVRKWMDDEGYILWLGTDILVRRSWVRVGV